MPDLLEHQRSGIPWLRDRPHSLLADEPGLGKTAQELLAAEEPVLTIAPAMVLDSGTWDDEIEKWAPGIELEQVPYTSLVQRTLDRAGRPTKPTERLRTDLDRRWGTVILDESHHIKTPGRKAAYWTKAIRTIDAANWRLATGTPIPNWAHEAFNTLQFIYPEEAKSGGRFGSYWRWAREWFHVGPTYSPRTGQKLSPMAVQDFLDAGHVAECPECLAAGRQPRTWEEFRAANWGDRMLMRLRDDCLDLPPLTIQEHRVHMKGEQARVYRALKKDFIAWLEDGREVVAWNKAAQVIKLWKCATGLELLGGKGSAKLDALRSILDDRPRPTLVVGFFRDTVKACADVAEEVGAEVRILTGDSSRRDRREHSRAFKRGDLPVLCATIDLIREGMNFQAADHVVRVERQWVPSRNEQTVQRLHRLGQKLPVLVTDLVAAGSLEVGQLKLLEEKSDQQVEALGKRDLARYLA